MIDTTSLTAPAKQTACDDALFARIAARPALDAAWARVERNRGAAGGDGVTVRGFAADAADRLSDLQAALASGRYRPGPARRVAIPKPDGRVRTLTIPSIADRVVQTAAAREIGRIVDPAMSDDSFGYRPGLGTADAVARVASLRRHAFSWLVDADVESFFDSVDHGRMLGGLTAWIGNGRTSGLIAHALRALAPEGHGLPQGAPISPLLSNLFLTEFDRTIGTRLVRYADDFVLLCRSRGEAEVARERAAALLGGLGLKLNDAKTRIASFAGGFRFLGRTFAGSRVLASPQETPAAGAAPQAATDPRRTGTAEPALRVLYLGRARRTLRTRGDALLVAEDERELLVLPPGHVDRIEIGPGCGATDSALRACLRRAIPVAYVDGWGRTLGELAPQPNVRGGLHLAQARHALDPGLRLDLARRIVTGRLINQRALLGRVAGAGNGEVANAIGQIKSALRRLAAAATIETLLGLEGMATGAYWRAWATLLTAGWPFERRTRQPPADPTNVVLSYLCWLLQRDAGTLAARHGLHPGFGALHAARDGNAALVSDIVEEFRAPLVEGLALYLINNRILAPAMFVQDGEGRCRAAGAARERIIRGWERWLDRPVRSPRSGHRVLWRRLIEEQICAYARHVRGEEPYQPYRMDY